MPTTSLLIGLFMLALAVVVVAAPLRRRRESARPAASRSRRASGNSSSAYEDSLLALRDLEFDHRLGIVADADHERVREHLMAEAARALASERGRATAAGGRGGTSPGVPAKGGSPSAARRGRGCPQCGKLPAAADRFCGTCGAHLTTAKTRAG